MCHKVCLDGQINYASPCYVCSFTLLYVLAHAQLPSMARVAEELTCIQWDPIPDEIPERIFLSRPSMAISPPLLAVLQCTDTCPYGKAPCLNACGQEKQETSVLQKTTMCIVKLLGCHLREALCTINGERFGFKSGSYPTGDGLQLSGRACRVNFSRCIFTLKAGLGGKTKECCLTLWRASARYSSGLHGPVG